MKYFLQLVKHNQIAAVLLRSKIRQKEITLAGNERLKI